MFSSSYEITLPNDDHTTAVMYFETAVQQQRINGWLFTKDGVQIKDLDEVSDGEGSLYEHIHFVMYGGVKVFGVENALKYMFPKQEHFPAPNFKTNGVDDRTFLIHLGDIINKASASVGILKNDEGNLYVGDVQGEEFTPVMEVPDQDNREIVANHLLMQYTAVLSLGLLGVSDRELPFFVTNPPADGVPLQNLRDVELMVLRALNMRTRIK